MSSDCPFLSPEGTRAHQAGYLPLPKGIKEHRKGTLITAPQSGDQMAHPSCNSFEELSPHMSPRMSQTRQIWQQQNNPHCMPLHKHPVSPALPTLSCYPSPTQVTKRGPQAHIWGQFLFPPTQISIRVSCHDKNSEKEENREDHFNYELIASESCGESIC